MAPSRDRDIVSQSVRQTDRQTDTTDRQRQGQNRDRETDRDGLLTYLFIYVLKA